MRRSSRSLLVIALAMCTWFVAGCKKSNTEPEPVGNPLQPNYSQPAQTPVRRAVERPENTSNLKQIALCYIEFDLNNNRPPAKLAEFVAYLRADKNFPPKMINPVEQGDIVVVANVKPTGETVIAYEKNVFELANNRLVAFGDGRVETMNEGDFQKVKPK